jgi:hypothetical protein
MNSDSRIFTMALVDIQPTQLYISRDKLEAVQAQVDFSNFVAIPPIPVKVLNGLLIMTDGHTCAFAAYLEGINALSVVWDNDELDWEAYQMCVDWCREEGITSIADLQSRVVSEQDYQEKWLDRCRKMQAELAKKHKEDHTFS